MNLAIRGIEGQIAHGDSFHNDRHPDLRADFILANPPFNVKDWGGERLADDQRWQFGLPPKGNANFGWVQHIVHHLAPRGAAGFVLANGSMSSNQSGEGEIRRNLIEADLVDCMVALPGQLFYSTQIPACLWFLSRDRSGGTLRDRHGETLFIDAREMGSMVDRTHRELTAEDIDRIAHTYHRWRSPDGDYEDEPGFCRSVPLDELRRHDHVMTPGRYVGAPPAEDDGEPFAERMQRLVAELHDQQAEARVWMRPSRRTSPRSGSLRPAPRRNDAEGCDVVTVRDAARALDRDGWRKVRPRGSHRQYRQPTKPDTVTVGGNLRDDLARGTWGSIKRQAGLTD